ncbi:MAG: hypothetical protein JOZ70_07360 [Pseudolabrys sp.]|nr:hypothetical protein [Pseudolabrys sp.]
MRKLIACLIAGALHIAVPGIASEYSDFNAAMERIAAYNRVAVGYLRTGNVDLASLELDRMREAWAAAAARFAKPPDALASNSHLYLTTMTEVNARLVAAAIMLGSKRPEAARDALSSVRTLFYDLRKANGIVTLADCIKDANDAMDALYFYNDRAIDWSKSETRFGVANKASIYGYLLERCDGMAALETRSSPEFRRLIDGAKAGLALVPKAINTRDGELLHRILIELRSFDNLLAFRYG